MSNPDNAFTAPITTINQAAFPLPRKRLGVWPAFIIALLTVALVCTSSYSLALLVEVRHEKAEIQQLRTHLSTRSGQIVHASQRLEKNSL